MEKENDVKVSSLHKGLRLETELKDWLEKHKDVKIINFIDNNDTVIIVYVSNS